MKVTTKNDALEIRFQGVERVWALRSWIVIPRSYIKSIDWHPKYVSQNVVWRIAGTAAPGILYAGYFRGQGYSQFLYIKKPRRVLKLKAKNILEVQTKNFRFGKLLLSVTPAQAKRVEKWWAA